LWDWENLRKDVIEHGVRNSLLTAVMPTASTSQIMGNNECIEPYTSNVYARRTMAGEFTVVNSHLMEDLIALDMWNEEIRDRLLYNRGSVQNIPNFPKHLKDVYKTVWEISQKDCIDMAADRGRFIMLICMDGNKVSKQVRITFVLNRLEIPKDSRWTPQRSNDLRKKKNACLVVLKLIC